MKVVFADDLVQFAASLLIAAGLRQSDAQTVANSLVDADLSGVSSHGVSRLGIYLQRLACGVVAKDGRPHSVSESPSALTVDAENAMGAVGAVYSMQRSIEKAAETGCCWTVTRNSNHFGTAGYYARMAAERGMIGIAMTNLKSKIAPWGSREGYMGTNPIAVAAPSLGAPLVLDMTPSVVALGKLILAQKLGESIPEGWALDTNGNPTTDPAEGRKGTLCPIGAYKGSGIAVFVDVFCGILNDGLFGPHLHDLYGDFQSPQGVGHAFCAIDIARFLPIMVFRERIQQMADEIRSLSLAKDAEEILLPGERSAQNREKRKANGIPLPDEVAAELLALGEQYHVERMRSLNA